MNWLRAFFAFLFVFVVSLPISLGEDIHDAVKLGDLKLLQKILEGDPSSINKPDENSMTPLHLAIDLADLKAASLLLEKGADVNLINYKKETPLHVAANKGNAEAVKLLLKYDADITLREMRDRIPLFLACNWGNDLETVRLLIEAGSDVNDVNSRGERVLVSTLFYGRKEIIDLLLDSGALIPDDERILRQVLFVTASNGMERPFNIAVEKCEKQNIEWWTGVPMNACARGGSVDIARTLIEKGVDFKEKDRYGVTPLHIAAENGRKEFIEFLLSKGVEIDTPSFMGKTALHFAQDNGHQDLAAFLVGKGASQAPPKFPLLEGDYLGQKKPGNMPQLFAIGIVSDHGFDSEHSPAVFSPDLKEMYWTQKFRGPILCMKQEGGMWTAPEKAPFCSEYGDGEPFFSPDGQKLFFLSFRPIEPEGPTDKENMWFVERTSGGWTEPKPVSPLINAFDLHWLFSVARSGTIYFASPKEGGFGANDIYYSRKINGKYEGPVNMGDVINSPGIDHTPFIAPDESYLIYVSTKDSPSPNNMRFYISYRKEDGTWMKPIDLGDEINSKRPALCPAVTPDGKYMFFIGEGDIFWVDAGFIEKLHPAK